MLIVGLGNPGKRYEKTRHNLGARAVEAFARANPEANVLLPRNSVFMNDFGSIVPKHKEILLVHDDIELPLGEVKLTASGSAKGHNGVRSIHRALGTTGIPRLRLGIGRPAEGMEVDRFVLGCFSDAEELVVDQMISRVVGILTENDQDVRFA